MSNDIVSGDCVVDRNQLLRRLPSVESITSQKDIQPLLEMYPRPVLIEAIRRVLADKRQALLTDSRKTIPERIIISAPEVQKTLEEWTKEPLRPVINATGVVVHTNLGRAPLSQKSLLALNKIINTYSNLEYNLEDGVRGSRMDLIKPTLLELTGAQDALVVNNNAAAVYLALKAIASGKDVLVSRGELVEIGGSFRVPDVMEASGAKLKEIGTTNRTRITDYQKAVGPDTGLLLKVHRSNFELVGFTQEVSVEQLCELARKTGVPFMMDLGSGMLLSQSFDPSAQDVTIQSILKHDPDLICFSGDKMLGGPQCGILLGKKKWISMLAKDPMARALRVCKLTLASLSATLAAYRGGIEEACTIPVIGMLFAKPYDLKVKAECLAAYIQERNPELKCEVCPSTGKVGGGAMPLVELPGFGVAIESQDISPEKLGHRLRAGNPAVIARLYQDRLVLDVRTVLGDDQLITLSEAVKSACLRN